MKRKFLAFSSMALCAGLLFTACKKTESGSPTNTVTDQQIQIQTEDESFVSAQTDELISDMNLLIESSGYFTGEDIVVRPICDADVVIDKDSDPMTVTITYDGGNCDSITPRTRTGVVVASMPKGAEWKTAGTAVTIDFRSVKIVRKLDNKTISLNGTQTYTNVSGGLLYKLLTSGPITHSITSSNMEISFDYDTVRTWNISKQRVYSYSNGIVLTVSGTHTEGGVSNIAEWGINPFGSPFTTSFTEPLVYKQACDFRLTGGTMTHATTDYTAIVTFGLNESGAPSGCPEIGEKYFYRLDWTRTNNAKLSIVLPY